MDYVNGWMHGSMRGDEGIWMVVGVLVIVLLAIVTINQARK